MINILKEFFLMAPFRILVVYVALQVSLHLVVAFHADLVSPCRYWDVVFKPPQLPPSVAYTFCHYFHNHLPAYFTIHSPHFSVVCGHVNNSDVLYLNMWK